MSIEPSPSPSRAKPAKFCIHGFAMIRNDADIISPFVAQVAELFDKFVFIDILSSDGTAEYLQDAIRTHSNLIVYQCRTKEKYQSAMMNALARRSVDEGADWLFFLDADEFIEVDGRAPLDSYLQEFPYDVMHLPWINLVPTQYSDFQSFDWRQKFHWTGRVSPFRKVAVSGLYFNNNPDAYINEGNHSISPSANASPAQEHLGLPLLHVPIRSFDRLKYKLTSAQRICDSKHNLQRGEGSHVSNILTAIEKNEATVEYLNGIAGNYGRPPESIQPATPTAEKWPEKLLPAYIKDQVANDVNGLSLGATLIADASISWKSASFVKDSPVAAVLEGDELTIISQPIFGDGRRFFGRYQPLPEVNPAVLPFIEPSAVPKVLLDGLSASLLPIEFSTFSAWSRLIPLLFGLFTLLKPRRYVELGVHNGMSFFAACQVAHHLRTGTQCVAVDSWLGDPHASFHAPDIFREFKKNLSDRHPEQHYIQALFSDALLSFDDESIDLLHIDGYHTYEAVKEDFETWLPKMSNTGTIIFHDINVHERGFGVWHFWSELQERYSSLSFMHSHGLGVLYVGKQDNAIAQTFEFLRTHPAYMAVAQQYFELLGEVAVDHAAKSAKVDAQKAFFGSRDDKISEVTTSEQVAIPTDADLIIAKSLMHFKRVAAFKRILSLPFASRRRHYKRQYSSAKALLSSLKR